MADSILALINYMSIRMRFCTACFVVAAMANGCHSREPAGLEGTHQDTGTSAKSTQTTPVRPSTTDTTGGDNRAAGIGMSSEDNQKRIKGCTAQADLIASREGSGNEKNVLGVQSHYSPAFNRCFLRINYLNEDARKNPILPLNYYELWDAHEDKLLSFCTDGPASGHGVFCNIEGQGFVNCAVCRSFVKDRMTK